MVFQQHTVHLIAPHPAGFSMDLDKWRLMNEQTGHSTMGGIIILSLALSDCLFLSLDPFVLEASHSLIVGELRFIRKEINVELCVNYSI